MANQAVVDQFTSELEARYRARTPKSAAIAEEQSTKVCPGGDYRSMVWWGPYPIIMEKATGAYLQDVDGHKYIDYANNWSSMVLGNDPKPLVEAIQNAIAEQGLAMSAATESVFKWAKLITDRFSSVDKIRFCCSGTEATMFALRTARAYSGKDKFVKLAGGFHGSYDPIHYHVGWGPAPNKRTQGVPASVMQDILVATPNDIEGTRKLLMDNKDEIGTFIMEPVMGAAGFVALDKEYVQFVREITKELGIVLIFDEVVTFRLAYGGAQEMYGVEADLTCFGKALASGMANGAWGGRSEIMEMFNQSTQSLPMFHSGTFIATPAVAAAGIVSLEMLNRETIDYINGLGDQLRERIAETLSKHGIKAVTSGIGSLVQLHWRTDAIRTAEDAEEQCMALKPLFAKLMLERGVFCSNRNIFVTTAAMTQVEMDNTINAIDECLALLKPVIAELAPELIA